MLVPVVLVSGFLGAGKTTFLRAMLNNTEGIKVAVVRNEFADNTDLSLEVPLLINDEMDDLIILEYPNSCVCCSARTAFVEAVHKLVSSSEGKKAFDLVVIELSGLTDPLVVGDEFITSTDPITDSVELRKVLTIIDSTMSLEEFRENNLIQRFVVAADLIFLNKKDRSPLDKMDCMQQTISVINPGVECIRTDHCSEFSVIDLLSFAREPSSISRALNNGYSESLEACSNLHVVNRVIIHENIAIKADWLEQLEIAIGKWIWSGMPGSIWRGKGLLALDNGKWAELQICGDSIALTLVDWSDSKDPWSRLLVIGTRDDCGSIRDVLVAHT